MKVIRLNHHMKKGWNCEQGVSPEDSETTVVFAFCAPKYCEDSQALDELKSMFPKSVIVGCSTSGEIHQDHLDDLSMSIAVAKFERTTVKLATVPIEKPEDSFSVGENLANQLKQQDLKGILVLSDGINANGSKLIEGFNQTLNDPKIVISGGLAGDGNRFGKTWILSDGKATEGHVSAIGFYGASIKLAHGTKGGWDIFGPERVITKSEGNILYEIDNKPALQLYKEYLGDKAAELPSSGLLFPLQIRENREADHHLVRTILGVNEEDQSLIFAGDMPEGSLAQLMKANFDRVIDGAADAAEEIKEALASKQAQSALAIAISCVGRRLALGVRAEEEVEALVQCLGETVDVVGFYSYGELAASIKGRPCELHNQSMTILGLWEDAA